MTTLTLKDEHGEYSVTVPREGMALPDLVEMLVIPALLAAGYAEANVRRIRVEGDECV